MELGAASSRVSSCVFTVLLDRVTGSYLTFPLSGVLPYQVVDLEGDEEADAALRTVLVWKGGIRRDDVMEAIAQGVGPWSGDAEEVCDTWSPFLALTPDREP